MAHRDTPARIDSTFGWTTIVGSAITSTAAVSLSPWPVSTQTTVLPGSSSIVREPGEAGGRGRLAEDALVARDLEPRGRDLRRRPRRSRRGGWRRARRSRPGAPARRSGWRTPASSRAGRPGRRSSASARPPPRSPSRTRTLFPPPPYGSASTSGARPSSSTISNAAVFWPSIRCGFSEFTSISDAALGELEAARAARRRSCRSPRRPSPRPRATAPTWRPRSRPAG